MTNEEAKRVLEFDLDHTYNDESKEALRIAIKALETIPKYKDAYGKGWDDGAKATYEHLKMCEEEQDNANQHTPNALNALEGDAISRQAVLEQTYLWSKDEFLRITNPFDYLRKRIKNLPPVNPQEPKMGQWILGVCDECGYDWGKDAPIASVPNFCPNCGARMESEDKG